MDQHGKLAVFRSQTANAKELRSAMRQVHRAINAALRRNNQTTAVTFTKVYALLFCAWAEANFSKVLHTPYGFDLNEIAQVQQAKSYGIAKAWKKCAELGLRHLEARRGSFLPNAQQNLEKIIDKYVFDPSLLRNKLAHGQWVIALNRSNDAVNQDLTNTLSQLNVITIDAWVKAHELLSLAVESLIESPKRAFMRDWYGFVSNLEEQAREAASRTLSEHVARLKKKDAASNAAAKRARSDP